jgi:hypothetical protein
MTKAGIVALGCALAALALGCGDKGDETPMAQPAASASPEAPDSPPAEITKDELPKFHPSDLPVFPDAKPATSMMVGGAGLIVMTSTAPAADVLAYYREQLPSQGWTVDEVTDDPARIAAHKEGRQATISITGSGGTTEIGISLAGS